MVTHKLHELNSNFTPIPSSMRASITSWEGVLLVCVATWSAVSVDAAPGADMFMKQFATRCEAGSSFISSPAAAAAGPPDTNKCSVVSTAWSPAANDAAPQFLTCYFETPVHATSVRIRQINRAPFVQEVRLTSVSSGNTYSVWNGKDTSKCGQWLTATFKPTRYETNQVVITTAAPGQEGVDSVELLGWSH